MTDIDRMLARIGELPLDARLAEIDRAVFAGLAEAMRPGLSRAAFGLIAGMALGLGVLANAWPGEPRQPALYPLGAPGPLAPSSLLDGGR